MLILNESERADLQLLEDTTVTLSTYNQVDDIHTSKVFENVAFTDASEYEIEFQVPPNLSSILVTVSTNVKVISSGEKKQFSESQDFQIENHHKDYSLCEQYLRNVGGVYEYILKGKNGEPLQNVPISFSISHKYLHSPREVTLRTNAAGVILLGPLKNVATVTA